MAIFFVLFRCRITGDEQPEIVMNQNWNCCWMQARGLAATMNNAAKRPMLNTIITLLSLQGWNNGD